ncbi:hypothetical protein, partial [Nocardia sp. NPDC055049]
PRPVRRTRNRSPLPASLATAAPPLTPTEARTMLPDVVAPQCSRTTLTAIAAHRCIEGIKRDQQ